MQPFHMLCDSGYQPQGCSWDWASLHRWDLNIEGDDCLVHSLHGHAKRSFSVVWSPLLPHLLLSGSDDNTARVWDAKAGSCLALLAGHQTEVRALCWHPELPWLVLTGMTCHYACTSC
jgi:WD40 repeat protein